MRAALLIILSAMSSVAVAADSFIPLSTTTERTEIAQQWYVSQLSPSFNLLLNQKLSPSDYDSEGQNLGMIGGYKWPVNRGINVFMEAGFSDNNEIKETDQQAEYHFSTGVSYQVSPQLKLESRITQMSLGLNKAAVNGSITNLGLATSYELIRNLDFKAGVEMQQQRQIMHFGLDYRF